MKEKDMENEPDQAHIPSGIGIDPNGGSGLTREMEMRVTCERLKREWLRLLRIKIFGRED